MKNKNVGFLIVGISLVIGFLILMFNNSLRTIADQTCDMGPSCTMYETISVQTWIAMGVAALMLVIGLFLIFAKEQERIVVRNKKSRKIDLSNLDRDERKVVLFLQKENGAIFQSTLMEQMEIGKVGMTRLLDKLEAKQIIERKRRGMNNIVVLKK